MKTKQLIEDIIFDAGAVDDDQVASEIMEVLNLNRLLGFLYGLVTGLFVSLVVFMYVTSRLQQIVSTEVPQLDNGTVFVGSNYGQQVAGQSRYIMNAPGNAPGEKLQRTQHSVGLQGN